MRIAYSAVIIAIALCASAQAVPVFMIDVDTTDNTSGVGAITTQAGWTSLDATGVNGSSVVVDGVTFEIASADGSRNRATGNDLTRDFVFDDGAGQAAGMFVTGLPDGIWLASVWSWDEDIAVGDEIILMNGLTAGGEFIATTNFTPDPNEPFTFTFDAADFNNTFGIFARENNSQDFARFNALRLILTPEPTTIAIWSLLGCVGAVCGWRMRRRRA